MTVYLVPEKGEDQNKHTKKYEEGSSQKNGYAEECMEKEKQQRRMEWYWWAELQLKQLLPNNILELI